MKAAILSTDPSLALLLVTGARLMRDRMEAALRVARLEITPGEARALAMADRLGPAKQSELAAALGIEPMSLVKQLDRLENRGLVQRKTDARDRRVKLVCLTEKAGSELRRIRQIFEAARRTAMRNFSASDAAALQSLLQRLCSDLLSDE